MKNIFSIGAVLAALLLIWAFVTGKISFKKTATAPEQKTAPTQPTKQNESAFKTIEAEIPDNGILVPIVKQNPGNVTGILRFNPARTGVAKRATTNSKGAAINNGEALILYGKDNSGNYITDKGNIMVTDVSITGSVTATNQRSDYTLKFNTPSSFKN